MVDDDLGKRAACTCTAPTLRWEKGLVGPPGLEPGTKAFWGNFTSLAVQNKLAGQPMHGSFFRQFAYKWTMSKIYDRDRSILFFRAGYRALSNIVRGKILDDAPT
jgi:hypothetical protein